MKRNLLLVTILTLITFGCSILAPATTAKPTPTFPEVRPPSRQEPDTLEIATEVIPSSTPRQPTITPTSISIPTQAPNPMSIEVMRARSYPGSEIAFEQELDPGINYRRFYASYQSDGLKIYALLTIPNGEMPDGGWPAIIFNHGYIPPREYRTTERYIAYVDRIARAGYIVFRIDYRGNDRSEGIPSGAYGDPGYTNDVLNAISSIERFPQANPQKIGIWGHSMGGFLTLRAMVISRDIKAGVIWGGVVGSYSDLMYNWHRVGSTPTAQPQSRGWRGWVRQYGTPDQNPDFWNSISATSYLADLSGPLQLHHGMADTEVPIAFSEQLAVGVRAIGGTVELYTYPGTDHNISQSFTLAMDRTIEFYDRYLK